MAPEFDEQDALLGERLERHAGFLPTDERALIEWKYFDRQSVRDIAARLQTTEKTIESRLGRIRRKLKEDRKSVV